MTPIGRRLEVGERVVVDSMWHPAFSGLAGVVARVFVQTDRARSSCGRVRCDSLCDYCGEDGPDWKSPIAAAELRIGARSLVVSADTWMVADVGTKRARRAMRERKRNGHG